MFGVEVMPGSTVSMGLGGLGSGHGHFAKFAFYHHKDWMVVTVCCYEMTEESGQIAYDPIFTT